MKAAPADTKAYGCAEAARDLAISALRPHGSTRNVLNESYLHGAWARHHLDGSRIQTDLVDIHRPSIQILQRKQTTVRLALPPMEARMSHVAGSTRIAHCKNIEHASRTNRVIAASENLGRVPRQMCRPMGASAADLRSVSRCRW